LTEILPLHDIAQWLQDIGRISHGEAHRLEQRIAAWANTQKAEGRREGIIDAARKAKFIVAGIKSPGQRAAAEKVLHAVERLLPQGSDERKEAYARGYTDGSTDERRKLRTKQPRESG
jgi:hypothetical protein